MHLVGVSLLVLGEGHLVADTDAPAGIECALCPARVPLLESLEQRARVHGPQE